VREAEERDGTTEKRGRRGRDEEEAGSAHRIFARLLISAPLPLFSASLTLP